MGFRPSRLALHVTAASAMAAGALVWGNGAPASAAARPASFGGTTTATGYHLIFDTNPALTPVADLFHVDVPYATTELDSTGGADASAASFYPGAGLLGVPGLLCQAGVPCSSLPPAPDYPLMATASYPTDKDSTATASGKPTPIGPATVSPSVVSAHADPAVVHAVSQAAGGGVSGVFVVNSVHAETSQHFEGSTLVVQSESVLKDVTIAGAVHVDVLRSLALAKVDGGKVAIGRATTTASGVTAAGQTATIDDRGIHVLGKGDNNEVVSQANKALAQALGSTGITARMLPPVQHATRGGVNASTSGLLITFKQTVENTPPVPPCVAPGAPCGVVNANRDYFGTVTLGGAGAVATADNSSGMLGSALGGLLGGTTGGGTGSSTGAGSLGGGPNAGPALPASSGAATGGGPGGGAPPVVARAGDGTHAAAPAGLVSTLTSRRLKLLALLLVAYPLVTLIGSRLHLLSRLFASR